MIGALKSCVSSRSLSFPPSPSAYSALSFSAHTMDGRALGAGIGSVPKDPSRERGQTREVTEENVRRSRGQ